MSYYRYSSCSRCDDKRRVWSQKYKSFIRCPKCSPLVTARRTQLADMLRMTAYSIKDYWNDPSREQVIQENIRACRELGAGWAELKDRTGKSTEELKRALEGQRKLGPQSS